MQVILDGVFNHASSDGMYFDRYNRLGGTPPNIGACLSLQSQWRTWFNFTDNNVPCSSADYVGWFGLDSLPTWNHGLDAAKDFFYRAPGNVTQYWYSQGASGGASTWPTTATFHTYGGLTIERTRKRITGMVL